MWFIYCITELAQYSGYVYLLMCTPIISCILLSLGTIAHYILHDKSYDVIDSVVISYSRRFIVPLCSG